MRDELAEQTIDALNPALQAGFKDMKKLQEVREFDPPRNLPKFPKSE